MADGRTRVAQLWTGGLRSVKLHRKCLLVLVLGPRAREAV